MSTLRSTQKLNVVINPSIAYIATHEGYLIGTDTIQEIYMDIRGNRFFTMYYNTNTTAKWAKIHCDFYCGEVYQNNKHVRNLPTGSPTVASSELSNDYFIYLNTNNHTLPGSGTYRVWKWNFKRNTSYLSGYYYNEYSGGTTIQGSTEEHIHIWVTKVK